METRCNTSMCTFEGVSALILQESAQFFCQNHKAASLPVMAYTSHVPEHFYNLKVQITGELQRNARMGVWY